MSNFYVSATMGDDDNPGTLERPKRTVGAALAAMNAPDPRDATIARLRRELADAADQIEAMSKEWACPGWDCVGGRMHPRDKFSRAATATATDCPHHAKARERVEAARRAAGVDTADPPNTPKI